MMTEAQIENLKSYIQALIHLHDTEDERHYRYIDQRNAEDKVQYLEELLRKE